jgi:hypothetical protein
VLGLQCWSLNPLSQELAATREFATHTGATMPLLLRAAYLQQDPPAGYGTPYDNYVLVDKDGIVRYTSVGESHNRPLGRYNEPALRAAIAAHLPTPVAPATWTTVKELYR